jgi:hypothetical protein
MLHINNIVFISLTLISSFTGYFFFFKDIFYGNTRPNLVSWFLWMLSPFIGVFFQLKAGAGISVIPVFLAGFGPLIVIIVSIFRKNSIWKITSFDVFCGILSLIALVIYIVTHSLNISIIFAILSDALAFIPTYVKGWKFPESETAAAYLPGILNNSLGLLVITNWIFAIYSFSIYLIAANAVFIMILYRKKIFQKKIIA